MVLPPAGAVVEERDVVPVHREPDVGRVPRDHLRGGSGRRNGRERGDGEAEGDSEAQVEPLAIGSVDWAVRFLHRRKVAELNAFLRAITRKGRHSLTSSSPSSVQAYQRHARSSSSCKPSSRAETSGKAVHGLSERLEAGRKRLLRAGASRSAASAVTARPSGSRSRRGSPAAASSCTARRRAARSSSSPISTRLAGRAASARPRPRPARRRRAGTRASRGMRGQQDRPAWPGYGDVVE